MLLANISEKINKIKWCVQIKISNNLPHMIYCENIVKIFLQQILVSNKLLLFLLVLTSNNPSLKIYCENIVKYYNSIS